MKQSWKTIISLLTGLPIHAFADLFTDKDTGMNETDRQYVDYLHKQVENGSMTEQEARELLRSKSKYGKDDEYIEKLWNNGEGSGNIELNGTGSEVLNGWLDRMPALMDSLISYFGHDSLTGAEREANEWSAAEAQKSRDFTMYMAQNKYQMETQSMQKAGLNPAMVYGGGNLVPTAANGAMGSSSVGAGGDPAAALMALVRMPLELKNLQAELDNKRAEADYTRQKTQTEAFETRIRGVAAQYSEVLTVQELRNMIAAYDNTIADTGYKTAQRDYVLTQKDAQETINKYLDERQQEELNQIKANAANLKADEAKKKAEKTYQDWYNNFVHANGFLPSSNDALMVATYIGSLFGITADKVKAFFNDLLDAIPGLTQSRGEKGKGGDTSVTGGDGAAGSSEGSGSR